MVETIIKAMIIGAGVGMWLAVLFWLVEKGLWICKKRYAQRKTTKETR